MKKYDRAGYDRYMTLARNAGLTTGARARSSSGALVRMANVDLDVVPLFALQKEKTKRRAISKKKTDKIGTAVLKLALKNKIPAAAKPFLREVLGDSGVGEKTCKRLFNLKDQRRAYGRLKLKETKKNAEQHSWTPKQLWRQGRCD